jgi:hypothetical protein
MLICVTIHALNLLMMRGFKEAAFLYISALKRNHPVLYGKGGLHIEVTIAMLSAAHGKPRIGVFSSIRLTHAIPAGFSA